MASSSFLGGGTLDVAEAPANAKGTTAAALHPEAAN